MSPAGAEPAYRPEAGLDAGDNAEQPTPAAEPGASLGAAEPSSPAAAPPPTTGAADSSESQTHSEAHIAARAADVASATHDESLAVQPAKSDDTKHKPTEDDATKPDNKYNGNGISFQIGNYKTRAYGFVQGQYQNWQPSENQLSTDGQRLLNQSGFSVARARAIIEGGNNWSAVALEYDVANRNKLGNGLIRAEGTLHWRNEQSDVPYVALTLGMFRTPFGFEAPRSSRVRLFTENVTITNAFFPGQSDIGFRLQGGYSWFRYVFAATNGHPVNEPVFGGLHPTKQGDLLGRVGVDTDLGPNFHLVFGVSLLTGKGFAPGNPATEETISVSNDNEKNVVNSQTVVLNPARAASPSFTFSHWGADADVELSGNILPMWKTWLRAEAMFGNNLDRALYIANPIANGYNLRGFGGVAGFENLLWNTGLFGVRYDFYNPNPDHTGKIGGQIVKVAQTIQTLSFLVGFQLPGTLTRLIAQYDAVKDHMALNDNGQPADLKNNRFTLRLQVVL